ncbi:MAG: tRNA pseudouridine(55) synthase TruB [Alphaproteobacteria bacterium]|nr:tRNA pseudouridine(55) synthase TruB [Alphaproteobacteria bacterium]
MDGIVIIDKPEGRSSGFVDMVCKKIFQTKKIGHIGTLDPFATGVLAIAVNSGTKAIPYINQASKIYEFEIQFGTRTDTGDKTGTVIEVSDRIPTETNIIKSIKKFVGEIEQIPPIYSAIKINGQPAYKLARSGILPNIKKRIVCIRSLELLSFTRCIAKFVAEVSAGTYIRTLAEDIAKSTGTVGHTLSLRRLKDGKFDVKQAIPLDSLRDFQDNLDSVLIPLEDVLDDIPVIFISCQNAEDLSFGRDIRVSDKFVDGLYLAKSDSGFLCIGYVETFVFSPKRLLRKK